MLLYWLSRYERNGKINFIEARNACREIEMIEQSIGTLGVALERKKIVCSVNVIFLRYIKRAHKCYTYTKIFQLQLNISFLPN